MHGAPLGSSDLAAVKKKFGFDPSQVHYDLMMMIYDDDDDDDDL